MVLTLLTSEEYESVKQCWKAISTQQKEVRRSFYTKLFEFDPSIKLLFRDSFLSFDTVPDSFDFMFRKIDELEIAIPEMKRLGLKHKVYGVKPKHYPMAKQALIWTLRKHLDGKFTKDMKSGWEKIFDFISEQMILGMKRK